MPSSNTSPVFFYTDVLQSRQDKNQYIGYTQDLRKRLEEHRHPDAKQAWRQVK